MQARNDYEMAYRAVAHSAFATCEQSAIDLKHACGAHLLTQNVATRLIALGFRPAAGHIGPEWAGWLTGQIGRHISREDTGADTVVDGVSMPLTDQAPRA